MIPKGSMRFWENRLKKFAVETAYSTRFGEKYLKFRDPDGLPIELVERDEASVNQMGFIPQK